MIAMDTITHGLLGATLAQLGFRQRLGWGATAAAVAAAVAPDMDLFIAPILHRFGLNGNGLGHWIEHRGITHSLVLVPILALVIAAIWWVVRRRRSGRIAPPIPAPFWFLYACVLLAYTSHPLLDWCTPYGTELLAPLSDVRLSCDVVPVVDVIFSGILALTLLACFLVRRAAAARGMRTSLIIGWAGFLLCLAYLCGGRVLHDRAIAQAKSLAPNATVVRAEAYPALGSILFWRVVLETDREWIAMAVRPLSGSPPPPRETAPQGSGPWVQRARRLPEVREYERFAMGLVRTSAYDENGRHVVEFDDMRYAMRPQEVRSLWPLRVTFDESGDAVKIERLSLLRGHTWWSILRDAWENLTG